MCAIYSKTANRKKTELDIDFSMRCRQGICPRRGEALMGRVGKPEALRPSDFTSPVHGMQRVRLQSSARAYSIHAATVVFVSA